MSYAVYHPQNKPVAVADGLWTIEGPVVPYRVGPVTVPCPTRSTILADPEGRLWIHSPIRYTEELSAAVESLGRVAGLIAPNTFHHLHLEEWADAFPEAEVIGAPGLEKKLTRLSPERLKSSMHSISLERWLDSEVIDGGRWCELVFHHRRSGTLILTDIVQNFELDRIEGGAAKLLLALSGAGRGPVLSLEMLGMAFFSGRLLHVRRKLYSLRHYKVNLLLIAHGAQPSLEQINRLKWCRRER